MKTRKITILIGLLSLLGGVTFGEPLGTAFTYQGKLTDGGQPAQGIYDFRFAIFDLAGGGSPTAGPTTNTAVGVTNGLFTVSLDFGGGVFTGPARWLEIGVRTNGGGAFTTLVPRQALTPSPYALYAPNAGVAGSATTAATAASVAANGVANASLQADAVTSDKIADGTVTAADVAANTFWQTSGNSGTTPGTHFVGTTDNQPLELRVNNQRALRLEGGPNTEDYSNIVNVVAGSLVNFAAAGVYGVTISGGGAENYFGAAATNSVGAGSDFATIGGGAGNRIYTDASYATIGGGLNNTIAAGAEYATIPGGRGNAATNHAFAAGRRAKANHTGAFLWADSTDADFESTAVNQFLIRASGGMGINTNAPQSALHVHGAVTATAFAGSGADLTSLDAGRLETGMVPDARLSANVSLLGQSIDSAEITDGTIVDADINGTAGISGSKIIGGDLTAARLKVGSGHTLTGTSATIAGGQGHLVTGHTATVGGGFGNTASAYDATVGGGWKNTASGDGAVVSGGQTNTASNTAATVAGGTDNIANGFAATVAGGQHNTAAGPYSLAAGRRAKALYEGTFVWADTTDEDFASTSINQFLIRASGGVGIGTNAPVSALQVHGTVTATSFSGSGAELSGLNAGNLATGVVPSSVLAGTYGNALTFNNPANSFSGSGAGLTALNASQLTSGTVPDGRLAANVARTNQVWLLGGNAGTAPGTHFLGTTDTQPLELKVNRMRALRLEDNGDGRDSGTVPDGAPNVIGGSPGNFVPAGVVGATIAGGGATNYWGNFETNAVMGDYGTIGGGLGNNIGANSFADTISGGHRNAIDTNGLGNTIGGGDVNHIRPNLWYATIAGGIDNYIESQAHGSLIGGGNDNLIDFNSTNATIAGGYLNEVGTNAPYSAIGGGVSNRITTGAAYATIPGGELNSATNYGFAAGRRAKAYHTGSFVWADSQNADFASTGTNQFLIRASGGVGIGTTSPTRKLQVNDPAAGALTYPVKISNDAGDTNNTVAGVLFQVGTGGDRGKGALVYERTDTWNRGKFHFLQNRGENANIAGMSDAVMTIANDGNVGIGTNVPSAPLDVVGDVRVRGLLRAGSETGTTQPPNPAGLVVRRINSTLIGTNQVVAVAFNASSNARITLERDGTSGGFRLRYPPNPGIVTIAAMGMDNTGTQRNLYTTLNNPSTGGTVQVYTDAQNIVHFECTFGDTYGSSHLTQVTLTRYTGDYYWSGTLMSTYNQ